MGEYGNGLTLADEMELDKQRVREALLGRIVVGEDEHGFLFDKAPDWECHEYILSVLDKWYYHAKQGADSGRALERMLAKRGVTFHNADEMQEFMAEMQKASGEYDTFVYEHELKELHEQANEAVGGEQ